MLKFSRTVCFLIALGAAALAGCSAFELESFEQQPIMGAEAPVIACSDGVDNDGDGFIDCADTDCQEPGTDEAPGPGRIVCST
ncbi:MAG: hypothetical protein RBU37_14335, partial [Myxococcota bacterium]|nr:hypothetical protein [Myxococcota bacterium]